MSSFGHQGSGAVQPNKMGRTLFVAGAVTLVPFAVLLVGSAIFNAPSADTKQGSSTMVTGQSANPRINAAEVPAPERPKTSAELRKEAAQKAKDDESLRRVYAKTTENMLLGENYNVDVTAVGPHATTLRLKWIFVSKVTAYQFANGDSSMFSAMKQLGFKHFVITDGYEETWTWTL